MPRRARRAKTDRIDGRKLLAMLLRVAGGERGVWKVVHVPSEADEDRRHLARTLRAVKSDRTRAMNRLRSLLATQGVTVAGSLLRFDVTRVRGWNGQPLLPGLHRRLAREGELLTALTQQLRAFEVQQRAAVRRPHEVAAEQARRLRRVNGIGWNAAWLYASEIFSWRAIRNGRELGALTGLVAAPYQSGATQTTRGITKAGNRQWRAMAVELAWGWLRYQPKRAHAMVSRALPRRRPCAADRNRGARAQTADRVVAVSRTRRAAGRRAIETRAPNRGLRRRADTI